MTAPIWVTPAGFLGTLTERVTTSTAIYASGTNVTYSILAGDLPSGIYLDKNSGAIQGTPVSVPVTLTYEFVVRAVNTATSELSDRTFLLDVEGITAPNWVTIQGFLPAGLNGEYYTFNQEYVDFQLRADTDILAPGNSLKYYIGDNEGQLPPGLTMTRSGRIYGFIDDTLKLDWQASRTGGYDTERFDAYPYDHAAVTEDVVDLYKPVSINKTYQFIVTVTDGAASAKRAFKIEVIDPNSLRADNSFIDVDTDDYDASSGYLLAPLWLSSSGNLLPKPANLGSIRASRNQVISLYEYDPYPFVGPVTWDWSTTVNPEIKIVTDSQFDFTGQPTRNKYSDTQLYFKDAEIFPVKGMRLRLSEYIEGYDDTTYIITGVVATSGSTGYLNLDRPLVQSTVSADKHLPDTRVIYVGSPSVHPPGLNLDPATGELYGKIPYQPAYSQTYRFTIKAIKTDFQTGQTTAADQIFLLTVLGDIDSYIQFTSQSALGTLIPGQISELAVVAENVNSEFSVTYDIVGGTLPPGLTFGNDGSIIGRVEYRQNTTFDGGLLTLDQSETTIDKNWYFTVRASDSYRLSAVEQTFFITVVQDSPTEYTRIFVKPFLSQEKRNLYREFVTDPVTFDSEVLYRPNDPEFGIQPSIKMVIETGIEKAPIEDYVAAMQTIFYRKRFYFGEVKSVMAQDESGKDVYELIYVDIIDNQMNGIQSPTYATSVANMQNNFESIEIDPDVPISVDERFRPRFMSTLQENGIPLGFVKVVPICYVLPGNSAKFLSRIKANGFDFKNFDFETDRVIVETPLETDENGWLFYPTDRR